MIYSPVNIPAGVQGKILNDFLRYQVHIATLNSGIMTPDSYDEYSLLGRISRLLRNAA